jgi:hypothetical protein
MRIQYLQWWFVLLFSLATSAAQTPANGKKDARPSGACGPPEYCAPTDRDVRAYPDKPPALGPAGSIVRDPTFGSRILRVTDANSDPVRAGRPLSTPASAEQNAWNTNSTMFFVNNAGGSFLLYEFDPTAMKAKPAGTPRQDMGGEPVFSFQHPNLLYGMHRKRRILEQYDASKGQMSDLDDPSKCVKLQAADSGYLTSISGDDNRFLAVLGPRQDDNYLAYVYDRAQGCRWYNTQTGEIGGQWGPKGTISIPDRFSLHNARMAKSGKFLYLVRGGGRGIGHGWVVWEIDTMKLYVCNKACASHHVLGYTHIVGPSGDVHPLDALVRPLNDLEATKPIIPGLQRAKGFWFDSHYSWNNVDPNDTAPVCFSTYRPNNPDTPGTAPLVTGPWENEIDCAEMDGKGSKIWRFAHTYTTARNGFWSTPRGNVSQDGRFYMFTSDWEDQLGKTPADKYRTDVFIVELR